MAPRLGFEDQFRVPHDDTIACTGTIFTPEEVLSHNTPEDCWLIIHGKVYDVTSWVPRHPGGSLIYVNVGKDSTQLFDSYHPLHVRKLLERYCIGSLKLGENPYADVGSVQYKNSGGEDFYLTLKSRVENYFRMMKVNSRVHPHMFMKSILLLAIYMMSYLFTFYWGGSLVLSIFSTVLMGFMVAEIGICIQHDANHGAYSNCKALGYLMSTSLDLVGASSFMWRQQHVVGHHSFTNVDGYDPDIRVSDPDLRRVTKNQPRRKYHYFQHWYLAWLYGLLAFKSIFVDDFVALKSSSIGQIKLPKMTSLESWIFWGGKLFYALYMLVLPHCFGCYSGIQVAILYLISQLVAGWTLAFMFQVAHVVEKADFPVHEKKDGISKVSKGWAELQVRTTNNFSTDSLFWLHVSGGLNFQIEHHLFPGLCHLYYPNIQPIVKETCKEFNVPYNSFPTFWSALRAHFDYLKIIGRTEFKLRLDG
ncbi:hypothetical protein KP509_23G014300 [Ceratopteris richardii]|uniref:Cytochrome b5 heme-binding domain-containing protein n=1 Tax=Ceratopteris richardii TaxID=49495 RepID=A0A8T2RXR5_CERRI|nr:hypothetical protein KP509_23G014300 [Ceratopteris richardii]KAH7301142.1 hypothetical protein KP509_23G014300 [Ceratopteris richardii]